MIQLVSYCDRNFPVNELGPVKRISQKIKPDENMPNMIRKIIEGKDIEDGKTKESLNSSELSGEISTESYEEEIVKRKYLLPNAPYYEVK